MTGEKGIEFTIRAALTMAYYGLSGITSAEECFSKYKKEMPNLNGDELAKEIINSETYKGMMTAAGGGIGGALTSAPSTIATLGLSARLSYMISLCYLFTLDLNHRDAYVASTLCWNGLRRYLWKEINLGFLSDEDITAFIKNKEPDQLWHAIANSLAYQHNISIVEENKKKIGLSVLGLFVRGLSKLPVIESFVDGFNTKKEFSEIGNHAIALFRSN